MNLVRKLVGIKTRPGSDLVSQSNQDDELCLRHLRKLFMEFRHSPTPMTVKEQENALFRMLPLFCKIFSNAKPSALTEKFGDVCQFAAHVSQLMVRETRKRASNRNHEVASKAVMDFLLSDSMEETGSGWKLLNSLNILAGGETPVLECMVAANLPSTMVKCLWLFYELPPVTEVSGKSIEDQIQDREIVEKVYSQILVKLCHSPATSNELVNTDDLSILFSAISCPCTNKHNISWRSRVSEILMTVTRYGLNKAVINYIHGKSCVSNCLENMRRIQRVNPLELVEMMVTFVCCLKDSSEISHLLLSDFSKSGGYLFLPELLLILAEIDGDEAREACRNIALLVSSLVMVGHVNLQPLVSIGTPFQDASFVIPEPAGGGTAHQRLTACLFFLQPSDNSDFSMFSDVLDSINKSYTSLSLVIVVSVKNIEAFHVLQKVFLKTTDKLLCLNILDCISNIYRSDNANYFILEPQHTISLFIDNIPNKGIEVQEKVFKLLDFVICHLNWVPCPELMSVSIMFKNIGPSDCHQVALSFLIRVLSFNPKYKDIFREVGILEVLTNCLKEYADRLKENDETLKQPSTAKEDLNPDEVFSPETTPNDYPFLLMGCLRLLLESNTENAKVFRECGGARCTHNMVPYTKSRTDALRIIHELILNGGSDDLGTLLGLMHSTPHSEVQLKIEVLNALLKVFELDPRTRAVFREVGGFVYVMSVPLNMEGSLITPAAPPWDTVDQEEILTLLRTVFHVLTAAMQDEPANKNFFMDEVRFRGLADTIRLLGCFSLSDSEMRPYTGDVKPSLKVFKKVLSISSTHLPLSATPSTDSTRSSINQDGPPEPDISPSSLLYPANEMFKNLFEMATDSFGLKAGNYGPTDMMNGLSVPHYGSSVLSIYHPGAITAVVDLLPAVCEMRQDDGQIVSNTEECLELQMYWLSQLQQLLRSEHNQQVMCQASLPQQLLQRCEAAFIDEDHPLNAPLQRMFERLASQALSPTVLRDFLRLGDPLLCKPLEPQDEEPSLTQETQLDGSDVPQEKKVDNDTTEEAEEEDTVPEQTDKSTPNEFRKISEVINRKMSDSSSRGRADSRTERGSLENRSSNLSFRDVMMSMIQPSPDSSFGEESDSDEEDPGFEMLGGETTEENSEVKPEDDSKDSNNETSPGRDGHTDSSTSPDEEAAPQRPPRPKRDQHRHNLFDENTMYGETMPVTPGHTGTTTVVDGVDIDTVGESQQQVSSIDQGDDLVILDVTGENGQTNTPPINIPQEEENQEPGNTLNPGLSERIDDSQMLGNDLSTESNSSRRTSQSSINSLDSSTDVKSISQHKAAEMSVEDINQQLNLHCAQEPELHPIPDETSREHTTSECQDTEDEPVIPEDKPVPLTRVKCLVSMTTPRDARAHGVSYCPSFVEFDMGVDGFGCLFMPAVAPQAFPGFSTVNSVVGNTVVAVGAVPGIGTGERLFPPQAGLTFTTWVCVDRYSNSLEDPHPVRLLTIARQFRSTDGKVQNSPCLTLSISAIDKTLVVRTEESALDDVEGILDQPRRERDKTEARFLSDMLLEEGRWHHVVIVLNKALIRNSTATLFVDGQHVATSRLKYMQAGIVNPDPSTAALAPYIVAYIGTPSTHRRCSRLLWKLGPTHLLEEPLSAGTVMKMFLLGPNYVGSFQAPCLEGESAYAMENIEPLVSEDKVMFGVHAHAQSVLSMAKIRKHFRKLDTRAIARELGLSTHDNTTPVRLIHNSAAHLQGPSRTIGAVLIGCSGLRTFCPNPVTKLIECIGSVSSLLGLVAMATDVEALYASVKALSCVLRSNPSARRDMERTRSYQILALLLRKKKHLLNTHILHLTFALVGTVDSDRESSIIPNRIAFRDLLCDLEVWHDAPGDLERSLYSHFLELLGPGNESQVNADLMQRLGLVPKLLFALQDETVTDSTAHTIASVLSVLLSNVNETRNLLKFGQFLASTISCHFTNENEINLDIDTVSENNVNEDTENNADSITPRRIRLRNVLLELVLCLIHGEGGSLDHRFADTLQETLGFDWLLLFLHPHIHKTTVVRATRILVTILGSQAALERFKDGVNNGGWLAGTEMILNKNTYVVAGFNVGAVSDGTEKYEVCKDVCNVPGFAMLSSLLPRHVDIPEIYHLVIALLLGHPVSDVYAGALFDWHNLYSVFWSSTTSGVKTSPPSPRDPAAYIIYCPEAATVLLSMARSMVNEAWENTEESSWLREYPVTLIQFLVFLYRNVAPFSVVCTGQEFLENLVAIMFPKRRSLARSQEIASDSEGEGETSSELVFGQDKSLLITHPARKCVLEFLRVIMTDNLTCTTSNKGLGVIDTILESYPPLCMQPQQAEYQTEVVSAQMDYFLGGNLLANPSAGHGNHAKIVANAFTFASKVVDKLWIGNFKLSYKVVFNFITSIMDAVKGQSVSMDGIYHSLNRTVLYQLSRPLARLTDQTSLLEFLHILTTNHKVVFAPGNNQTEFIAGVCHWLLVMGTQKKSPIDSFPSTSTPIKETEGHVFPQVFGVEDADEAQEQADNFNEVADEESSCTRLLAAAAERVWDIFLLNKRDAIDETFKIELPKPSFTSYSPRMEYMPMGRESNLNLDLKSVRPIIGDTAMKLWVNYVTAEEKHKAEALGQQKPKRRTVARLTTRRTKKDTRDVKGLIKDSFLWTPKHIKVVKDWVRLQHKNHQQNYQLISKSIAEDWTLMERDLTRERGLWGPPDSSTLDKWTLDLVEGPHRMLKKMCRNEQFYVNYPYDYKSENCKKRTRYKKAMSSDSKKYYMLRGPAIPGVGPIETLLKHQETDKCKKEVPTRSLSTEPSYVTETNEESEVDNQTIVKLLEAGEKIRSMYRCARVQGLDTAEGLFLFGQMHFYVVDGVTLLSSKEIKDIDSLPPGTHDPIIPRSSHDITKSCTKERMCSKWSYDDIREVHKRRYLLQQTALEVFSSDGRNHFLVFPKPVRNKVYEKFLASARTLLVSAEDSISGMRIDTDIETGVGIINSLMGERSVTQRWERGEITNFQYLMHLNTLAGRSYNDLMQYPVFPWILADYESEELDLTNPKTFRDFSKPMGAQGESRLEHIKRRYKEWEDPTGETPPYHYGTHYSSAMIVASYLIRMEPFSQHFLRLQGGHFDLPDRLFHSVKDSWLSASETNIHDVKELIPEFFYLPEFLTNHNNFDLGTKQNGDPLGDVLLPTWAKDDPREFIRLHRKALECDFVSARLHEWIDLIFGYRQQGPGAIESYNVFHHLFYEGNVDIHGIDDQVKKTATIGFINNFGQTPKQLFKKPHPQKKVFRAVEPELQTGVTSAINVDRLFFHNLPNLVPSAQPVKELKAPVGRIYQSERGILAVERNKVLIPPNYNRYVAWGFGDLSMRIGYYDTEKVMNVYENFHIGQVLCVACPDSRTLITGGTSTLVCVWDIVKGGSKGDRKPQLLLHEVLYGHQSSVTCLTVSTCYQLIVSGSEDHTCIIWDLSKLSYVRQLSGHAAPITAIAINELTGDITTCAGTYLYVWSVNGQLIVKDNTSLQTNNHIQCCAMSELSDWDEENVILTGSLDGVVRMWGIEFHNEAEIKSPKSRKSVTENSLTSKETITEETSEKPEENGTEESETPNSDPVLVQNIPEETPKEENENQDNQSQPENDNQLLKENEEHDTVPTPEVGDHVENTSRAPKLSQTSQFSSNLDEEYVIIENEKQSRKEARPKPVWRRRLTLRHKLTMHTSFVRDDNMAPAAITALLISKDHRKLFVGDGRGRIYSWSVTDAAGRLPADHWIKDEGAESCTQCTVRFTFAERRHHCRDCGKLFCAKCSKYESSIHRLRIYKPVRVCKQCYDKLKKEQSKGIL